jgi:trehalose 6-phosphate phosphatase
VSDLLSRRGAGPLLELARPGTLVVLDFDGTLAPIVADRDRARLPARTRRLLGRLARAYPVAILSGRAADDVAGRLGDAPVRWVVGSHGAEWPGEAGRHPAWRRQVRGWRQVLARRLAGLAGVEVEEKPHSLAVHWRGAADRAAAQVAVARAARGLAGAVRIPGKAVLNVVPAGAGDKGAALARLVAQAGAARVLFVGDDATDEAAFSATLPVPAVMVRVGRHPESRAAWWLPRQADVGRLLERLVAARRAPGAGAGTAPPAGQAEEPIGRALGAELAFMKDLWAVEQALEQRSRRMQRRQGVTMPQRLVIRVVGRLGPVAPARLARILHLHPSSVTRLTRRLEARGLLERRADPTDRRRLALVVTLAGRRVERLREGTAEQAVRQALAAARPAEVAAARRLLARLAERLGQRLPESP